MIKSLKAKARSRSAAFVDPALARVSDMWAKTVSRAPGLPFRKRQDEEREEPAPSLVITPMPEASLVIVMTGSTAQSYVESGQVARLSSALERYGRNFDHVTLLTPDRVDLSSEFEAVNVAHMPAHRLIPGPAPLRMALSVVLQRRRMRRTTTVLALDEAAALPGWLIRRLSGADMVLSIGAPWAPKQSKMSLNGLKMWPLRQAVKRISSVTLWEGVDGWAYRGMAALRRLPAYVDCDLYCPLVTTDPNQPRMVGAFLPASDTESAIGLIGVAERLRRDGHNVMFRVFVLSGAEGEARAAALQGDVNERSAPIEFLPLPRIEILPDVLARLLLCVSFDFENALPFTLRAMASGVPCIVVGPGQDEAGGWRDFVIESGPSNEQVAGHIEVLLREPGLRLRMAQEGRRLVVRQHSLDSIAAQEASMLKLERAGESVSATEPQVDSAKKAAGTFEDADTPASEEEQVAA